MKTGTALESTGRSSLRNGARFLVAGFAVSTSGSRSSSAARRLTKVVLLWRMNGGSSRSVWSRASFWLAIAPKAVLALEIALESSLPRWATAVESLAELTTKRSSRFWSAFSSPTKAAVRFSAGPKYLKVWLASSPRLENCAALPRTNWPRARRTGVGKVLRNWSRSTSVVVEPRPRVAPPSSAGLLFGPGLTEM